MPLLVDETLTYRTRTPGAQHPVTLRIRIYETPEGMPVVIFTDPLENRGQSLINSFERAAALVLRRWLPRRIGQNPAFLGVQHIPRDPDELSPITVPGYTRVRFADYDVRPDGGTIGSPGWDDPDQEQFVMIGEVAWLHDVPVSHAYLETLVAEKIADPPVNPRSGNEY